MRNTERHPQADFLIETIKQRISEKRQLAHEIEREVYPYLAVLANPIDQAHFIRNIAELVRLPEAVIREGVSRAKPPKLSGEPQPVKPVTLSVLTRRDRLEDLLLGFVAWRGKTDEKVKELVSERWGNDFFTRRQIDSRDRESEQSFMAEVTYAESRDLTKTLIGLLDEWQVEVWREELTETVHRLKELDPKAKPKLVEQYLKRCKELSELIFKS